MMSAPMTPEKLTEVFGEDFANVFLQERRIARLEVIERVMQFLFELLDEGHPDQAASTEWSPPDNGQSVQDGIAVVRRERITTPSGSSSISACGHWQRG